MTEGNGFLGFKGWTYFSQESVFFLTSELSKSIKAFLVTGGQCNILKTRSPFIPQLPWTHL